MRSTVNKRVMKDITDGIKNLKSEYGIYIAPEEDNFYNVHFVIPGPEQTPYEGGLYHGFLRLNQNHPLGPPNIHMITPSGRFDPESHPVPTGSRGICFTYTSYHPEQWTPTLNIESILKGFISFMCDDTDTGMKTIVNTPERRKQLAIESHKKLLAEPIIATLFPELYTMLKNGTYVATKISDLGKNKVVTETKSEANDIITPKTKKTVPSKDVTTSKTKKSAPSKDVTTSKTKKKVSFKDDKIATKKIESSESSELFTSSESDEKPKPKPKSKKKIIKKESSESTESESEEKPKSKSKKTIKKFESSESASSESEEKPKSKSKKTIKKFESSESASSESEEKPKSKSKKTIKKTGKKSNK